jgi:hypothetical protein
MDSTEKIQAIDYLASARKLILESLKKFPDDDVFQDLLSKVDELHNLIKSTWPLPRTNDLPDRLNWHVTHNLMDINPEIGLPITAACILIIDAKN